MKKRVTYDSEKVTGIYENDTSFTYTAENVICGDISEIGVMLRIKGIDTKMIEDFEAGLIDLTATTENTIEL